MTQFQEAQARLELRGEVTVNYLRALLVVVFSLAVAVAYITDRLLASNLPFFAAGIAIFALTALVSVALMRLGRMRPSIKYWFTFLEFVGFFLSSLSYLDQEPERATLAIKSRSLFGVYFVLIAGSALRFSPRFSVFAGALAVACHTLLLAVFLRVHSLTIVPGVAIHNPATISISEIVVPTIFLISTAAILAAGSGYIRELLLRATISEQDARRHAHHIEELMRETGQTATNLETTVKNLNAITVANEDLGRDQLAAIEETSATMEEMSASTRSIADKARDQDELCDANAESMQNLNALVTSIENLSGEATLQANQTIAQAERGEEELGNAVDIIERIQESSNRVADIVTVINGIADKTNLLALNAAIEAARAGEEGRGFSVVADEVGKLAELSSRNAREIERVIKETQQVTETGVTSVAATMNAIQDIMSGIRGIANIVSEVHQMLKEQAAASQVVVSQTGRIQQMSRGMRDATEEQLNGSREVLRAIDSINSASEQYVHSSEKLRQASTSLLQASHRLNEKIATFRETESA